MNDWTNIDTYIDAPSLLDIVYARTLIQSCQLAQLGAYDWLIFCDQCGLDDPGDFYDHLTYPEVRA